MDAESQGFAMKDFIIHAFVRGFCMGIGAALGVALYLSARPFVLALFS